MPWTATLMWIATLAIAGIPGFSGFFSKDGILAATWVRGGDHPAFYLLWFVGAVTALLTAFYMTRMMLYAFHGPNRTGEEERKHLSETPWVMTGPLVVLGVGSVLAGVINLPHILPGSGWLEHWLEPVTELSVRYLPEHHLSSGTEWMLIVVATTIAIGGIALALILLKPQSLLPAAQAPEEKGLGLVLLKKWYVDEIYDGVIVRPMIWISRRVLWRFFDTGVIDGALVNGSAWTARVFGFAGSALQTGRLGWYLLVFVVGTLALLRVVMT